jgi:hypothetical protein
MAGLTPPALEFILDLVGQQIREEDKLTSCIPLHRSSGSESGVRPLFKQQVAVLGDEDSVVDAITEDLLVALLVEVDTGLSVAAYEVVTWAKVDVAFLDDVALLVEVVFDAEDELIAILVVIVDVRTLLVMDSVSK